MKTDAEVEPTLLTPWMRDLWTRRNDPSLTTTEKAHIAKWCKDSPKGQPPSRGSVLDNTECINRDKEENGSIGCQTCKGNIHIKTFPCSIHGKCTLSTEITGVKCCKTCKDRIVDYPSVLSSPPPILRRNLIYHMHPIPGAWQWHVSNLQPRLSLFNGRRIIAVTTGPGLDYPESVASAFPSCEIIPVANNPSVREVSTFETLFSSLTDDPNEATLFAHSKGVTRRAVDTARRWTEMLYQTCMDYWPVVENLLNGFPIAGSFLKAGQAWRPDESASQWHYSGSWFWFRNKELYSKPDWKKIDHFWCGIESYPSLHFKVEEAACIFHRGTVPELDLYNWNYLTRIVEPKLTEWQQRHVNSRTRYP